MIRGRLSHTHMSVDFHNFPRDIDLHSHRSLKFPRGAKKAVFVVNYFHFFFKLNIFALLLQFVTQ